MIKAVLCSHSTCSISESEDKLKPSSTSGAVNALRSCWVTFSSVKEMFPEGMSSRDHGEMMKPRAVGSAGKKHADKLLKTSQVLKIWSKKRRIFYIRTEPGDMNYTWCTIMTFIKQYTCENTHFFKTKRSWTYFLLWDNSTESGSRHQWWILSTNGYRGLSDGKKRKARNRNQAKQLHSSFQSLSLGCK